MFKRFIVSLSTSAALLLFAGTSEAVLVFSDDELTTAKAQDCFSRDGFEAVCVISGKKNGKEFTGTGTLVHPNFVLTSEHTFQERYEKELGFLASSKHVNPESLHVSFGGKEYGVARIVDDLEDESGDPCDNVQSSLLSLASLIQKQLGDGVDSATGIDALANAMYAIDSADDYALLQLETSVTDIKPLAMRPLALDQGQDVKGTFTMCGYGMGAVLPIKPDATEGWAPDKDVLSMVNQTVQFRTSTADCVIKSKELPEGLADDDVLLYVYSGKQAVLNGDSGGPLIDNEGNVVGVAQGMTEDCDEVYYSLTGRLKEAECAFMAAGHLSGEMDIEKALELYQEYVVPALKEMYEGKNEQGFFGCQYAGITPKMIEGMAALFEAHDAETIAKDIVESAVDGALAAIEDSKV